MRMIILAILLIIISFMTPKSGAYGLDCRADKRDRESKSYYREVYDSAALVGTFEVLEIGNKDFGEGLLKSSLAYQARIKFKIIKLIKGNESEYHLHDYMKHNNEVPFPFVVGKKYLIAFEGPSINHLTKSGCRPPFQKDFDDAEAFIKKFDKFKK